MPDFRLTLPRSQTLSFPSSAPAVGSTEALAGSCRGTSPVSYECRDWRSPPRSGVSISRGQILAIMLSRGRELGETCHRPGPGTEGGLLHIGLPFFPAPSPATTTQTPPSLSRAKPPSPDSPPQDARQTLLSGHVANPRAERSCVWPELYPAYTSSGSGLTRGEEAGSSEKAC